jgi:catalase-peroxidase
VPEEVLLWQDPVPAADYAMIDQDDIEKLQNMILDSGLSNAELVRTAWASASSFRGTDMRGGANGGRIRLAPQKDWAVNNPDELARVLTCWRASRRTSTAACSGARRSRWRT